MKIIIQTFKILLLIITGLLLVKCIVDNEKVIDPHNPQYKTTDPSELFFKNVRALYYDKKENEIAKMEVFRIKSRPESSESAMLDLAIVLNWRFDEAYILIKPDNMLSGAQSFILVWKDEKEGIERSAEVDLKDKNSQFKLASTIYVHILNGHKLYYLKQGEKGPLFKSKKAREAYRITMFDYYNLVELL